MTTIEDFFLQRYEQLESERDGLQARVADLERQMQADGGYGARPGGRVRAVMVDAASRYDFPDDPCMWFGVCDREAARSNEDNDIDWIYYHGRHGVDACERPDEWFEED